jgi:hypothetical protein
MKTFIYDIVNQKREGIIRDGWCSVGGQPCTMPEGYVELEIVRKEFPTYNEGTQVADSTEYADIPNKKWYIDWVVRNLTSEEIEDRKPKWNSCSPRQFRLALLNINPDPNYVDNLIDGIQDETKKKRAKIEWEYATEIKKNHPFVEELATYLNLNQVQLNELFGQAVKL